MLALRDVALVPEGDERLETQQDDGGNHEADADAAGGRVVDADGAVLEAKIGLGAADDGDDDGDDDEQLDQALVRRGQDDVALAVDRVEDAAEEAEQHEHEGAQAQAVDRHPADPEGRVCRVVHDGEAEGEADDAGDGEDDEVPPARRLLEAVLDGEKDGADEEDDVDGDADDRDDVVRVKLSHCDGSVLGLGRRCPTRRVYDVKTVQGGMRDQNTRCKLVCQTSM